MSNEKSKKTLGIISKVLSWVIIAVTACMMIFTLFSTLTFDRNDRSLFGVRFYVVLSDSMSLSDNNKDEKIHFNAGDIIMSKKVKDYSSIEEGDVISFISQSSTNFGETVTHQVKTVRRDDNGKLLGYVTFGSNTGAVDEALVEPEYVLGEYTGRLPGVGHFFSFLKTTPGYIVCILIPFLLLIGWQGANTIRLFKQYKGEQMAEMVAEREQIAKEREESAQMMRELLALKAQLAQQQSGEASPPASDTPAAEPEAPIAESEAPTAESENQ